MHDVALWVCVRSKDAQRQVARTSLKSIRSEICRHNAVIIRSSLPVNEARNLGQLWIRTFINVAEVNREELRPHWTVLMRFVVFLVHFPDFVPRSFEELHHTKYQYETASTLATLQACQSSQTWPSCFLGHPSKNRWWRLILERV